MSLFHTEKYTKQVGFQHGVISRQADKNRAHATCGSFADHDTKKGWRIAAGVNVENTLPNMNKCGNKCLHPFFWEGFKKKLCYISLFLSTFTLTLNFHSSHHITKQQQQHERNHQSSRRPGKSILIPTRRQNRSSLKRHKRLTQCACGCVICGCVCIYIL